MPLECVAITCAAQNHVVSVSGNFAAADAIAVPAVSEGSAVHNRGIPTGADGSSKPQRVPGRTRDKQNRPASVVQKEKQRSAAFVGKFLLELRQRASAPHRSALPVGAALSAPSFRHYI